MRSGKLTRRLLVVFPIVKISNFMILRECERLMTIMFEITVVATIKIMAISEKQYHFTFQGCLLVHNHTQGSNCEH